VKTDLLPKVAHLTPYSDLKDGHKRTLALIAYKEPIKQSEIVRIQGNKAYSYIKLLTKKGLIKSEKEGRTRILMLTKEFERYFGEEKERIKEMLEQGLKGAEETKEEKETQETEEQTKETEGEEEKTDSDMTEIIPFDKD
ncbi:MAG: SMC-Scp complex subunit ScpB, partial [Candidatus Aenigmarchaeota archaeon]|nr:SMC-Scp complex subunit ScpB [Candidatus Aenigmarchaeota archaeon]